MMRQVRYDAHPQPGSHPDLGCDVAPRCVECPLPMCRFEHPGGIRGVLKIARNREIVRLYEEGVAAETLAERFGTSERTVWYAVQEAKTTNCNSANNGTNTYVRER